MMAPDYAHWHGMFEVAERFYMKLIPEARELCDQADDNGQTAEATAVRQVIDEILARPEHSWYEAGQLPRSPGAGPSNSPPENSSRCSSRPSCGNFDWNTRNFASQDVPWSAIFAILEHVPRTLFGRILSDLQWELQR